MNSTDRAAQPGLEVSSQYDTTPISLHDGQWASPTQTAPAPNYHQSQEQKILIDESLSHPGAGAGGYANENGTDPTIINQKTARRTPWLLIGLGGLATFVLAGIIGGIAGWKVTANQNQDPSAASRSGSNGNSGSGSNGGSSSTAATKIMSNSALSAVGWRYGTDINLNVWFQGPNAAVRRLEYDSTFETWTAPMDVDAAARAGSPFGANMFWLKPDPLAAHPQAELFYLGSPDKIMGVNWRQGWARGGQSDSINEKLWTINSTSTQMAAYWPSFILQADNGDVIEVFYNTEVGFQEPKRIGVTASAGSGLVILPRETLHSAGDKSSASSARIIYRDTTGRLRNFDRSSGGLQLASSGQLPVTIDANFTMAGFAVARQESTTVNTWIVYQDAETGKISYVYEDDSEGWKGPETDAVFDGADNPTHLACITAASATSPEVPLQPAHDLSYCFFQAGKKLKYVHFDGIAWTDMGFIAIP